MQRFSPVRVSVMAAALLAASHAGAQSAANFPSKPVRVIIGFSPGGPADMIGRIIAPRVSEVLGQQFVIENRGGASGTIGVDAVAKAPADGYTIGFSINGPVAVNKFLYSNLPYDPQRDLAPVSLLVAAPQLLAVNAQMPVDDFRSFVAYSRKNPGKLTYGSVGAGSASHLTMELLKEQGGFFAVHLPYRGFPQVVQDLGGGSIDATIGLVPALLPAIQAGKLKALAVTSEKRSALLPDVPTISELGFPNFDSRAWIGLIVPAGTPKPIVERLNAEARKALQDPAVRETLQKQGFEIVGSAPEQFARFIEAESSKWGAVVKKTGAKVE